MFRETLKLLSAACFFIIFSQNLSAQTKSLKTIIVDAGHGGHDGGAVGQYENSLRSKEKDVTLAISMKLMAELKKQLPDVKVVPTRTTDVYESPTVKARKANDAKGDLFLCIHADSGPVPTGKRQVGTRTVTRHKVTYTGKGKKRKKKSTPYQVEEPVYEYYKIPLKARGTSVWIFAPHKTSVKLKAIMEGMSEENFMGDGASSDSVLNEIDFSAPEYRQLAQVYAKLYQEKSDKLATLVNDEVEASGRPALGVSQRQVGIWVLQATKMPAILIETGFINNPEDERYISSDEGQQELAEVITRAVIRYKAQIEGTKIAVRKP